MKNLILLYWGTILLMYLSQTFYPQGDLRNRRRRGNFILDRSDLFLIVIIGWISAFSFLRNDYNDTVNYIYDFLILTDPLSDFLASGELFELGGCPLFNFYQTFVREFTKNYHILFFFPAVLNAVAMIKFIKRYSVNPPFTLLIFYSIGTYVMYIAAMKQSIAVGILLIALPYAMDRKYLKFYALVLLAMLFHTHAFVFLAVPFFFGKPWGKVTLGLLAAVVVAILTYNVTFGTFMNVALSMGINVVDWEVFDGHSINPIRVIIYWIPALIALFFRKRLFTDSTREENLFVNLSIGAAFILSIGLRQGANLFARMAAYYEIAVGFALPWMIAKIFNKRSANLILGSATVLYFCYFLYEFGINQDITNTYFSITIWEFIKRLFTG